MFIFLIIGNKYIGIYGVANLDPTYTYSWKEISQDILYYLFGSLLFAIPLDYGLEWAKNADKKSIEEARKRIKEREGKEKEQKLENLENEKEENNMGENEKL